MVNSNVTELLNLSINNLYSYFQPSFRRQDAQAKDLSEGQMSGVYHTHADWYGPVSSIFVTLLLFILIKKILILIFLRS